jgi:nucleotide-binding universal stress UspA family protein
MDAAEDLAARFSPKPARIFDRVKQKVFDVIGLDRFDPGPSPGRWRREHLIPRQDDRLFSAILVPVRGDEVGWMAFEQAAIVARREQGRLRGLYVLGSDEEEAYERALSVQVEFDRRCEEAGVPGEVSFETGNVAEHINERASWNDLVVVHLDHPPEDGPLGRLQSGFQKIIQSSPRPVLAVPSVSEMSRALLAYDGSPKAEEALFLSAYLASQWGTALVVLGATDEAENQAETEGRAKAYLESQRIEASYVRECGPSGDVILKAAEEEGCDLIVMGGYGAAPVVQVIQGSVVDQVLREFTRPVLICR